MHALVCPFCRIALPPVEDVCPRDGHAGEPVAWLQVPYTLSQRFNVLEPFAHGRTGSLYIVDEPETGRRGLLKVLAPAAGEQLAERQRLRRELVKQATLTRTHLLLPLASGESEGSTWIFREWLDGVSLDVRLSREGSIRQTEALAIAAQIASALDELHRGGVLHRDVKPGHIFLQPTSQGIPRAVLIDAGLASAFANFRGAPLYGTPGYVAPEQLLGKLVSFRSDLYSLGCVLYRMLTGRPAFSGETLEETLTAQRQGELPQLPAGLPQGIGALLQSILSREPQDRPFSAQKLRRTLDPFLPDGALMEKQTTATFETVKPTPSAAPQASGTLRPPPPPPARASHPAPANVSVRPKPPTAQRTASPRDERTHQLDLDQLEEFLPPPRRPTSAPPPVPSRSVSSAPPPVPGRSHTSPPPPPVGRVASEKTQPIRLDQILGISNARKAASSAPPALREEEPSAPLLPVSAAGSLFAAAALEPSAPETKPSARTESSSELAAQTKPIAARDPSGTATSAAANAPSAEAARPPRKATLMGMGNEPLASNPAEVSALASVEARERKSEAALSAESALVESPLTELPLAESALAEPAPIEPAPVLSERDHPTERIPTVKTDDSARDSGASATESITGRGLPALGTHDESRKRLMYASAAIVGLAVMGVGATALLSSPQPEASQDGARYEAPPPLPAAAAPAAIAPVAATPVAQGPAAAAPVAAPTPVVEPLAASSGAAKANEPAPTSDDEQASKSSAVNDSASERSAARAAASAERAAKREQAREERHAAREAAREQARTASADKAGAKASKDAKSSKSDAKASGPEAFAAARDEARAHYAAKRFKEAAVAYERAVKADPKNAGAYAGLGAARLQLGDNKAALKAYQQAAQISPETAGFHAALGRTHLALGDKARALASYKKAVALDPKNEAAKTALRQLGG
jgi:eukaryotic-like serine/threonine-protein kinase